MKLRHAWLLIAIVGCADTNSPERPAKANMTGDWAGPVDNGRASFRVTVFHDTVYGGVIGEGYMEGTNFNTNLHADGVFADSTITLTLSSQGVDIFSMHGTHRGDEFSGTLDGSGYSNTPFKLLKK